jgi:hypothetical protein
VRRWTARGDGSAFEGGNVLLVGDAAAPLPPPYSAPTATGAQTAQHALALKDYMHGKISLQTWHTPVPDSLITTCWFGGCYTGNTTAFVR